MFIVPKVGTGRVVLSLPLGLRTFNVLGVAREETYHLELSSSGLRELRAAMASEAV